MNAALLKCKYCELAEKKYMDQMNKKLTQTHAEKSDSMHEHFLLCALFKCVPRGIYRVTRRIKPDEAENKPDRPVSLSI